MSDWEEEIEAEARGVKLEKKRETQEYKGFGNSNSYSQQPPRESNDDRRWNPTGDRRGAGRGRGRGRARSREDSNWRNRDETSVNGGQGFGDRSMPSRNRGGFGLSNGESRGNKWDDGDRDTEKDGYNSDYQKVEMIIFNDRVGKVIGKGGQMIREIQSTSGATVRILKEKSTFEGTPVEIFGNPSAIEKAQELLTDINTPSAVLYQKKEPEAEVQRPKINWSMIREESENYEKRRWAGARPIKKFFYTEVDHIKNLGPRDVAQIRKAKNNISVQDMAESEEDRDVPNPVLAFEDAFHNYPGILDTIYNAKFTDPSPIQSQSWPVILSGMDMIGIAQTGTGKTLAFLLPAFIHIDGQGIPRHERKGPSCLVLSPTRELAQQIEQEVRKFNYKGIKSICIYGGGDRRQQISEVRKGVEIVIGTPGRLNDLLMNEILHVSDVTYLVLDEADRMLDMGFEPEIKKIILDIRPDRQTIMTSATWPPEVQRLADQYLKDPIKVNVGSLDLQACHSVTQLVEVCEAEDKKEMVIDFINGMGPTDKLLIFVGRKVHVDDMASDFALRGIGTEVGIQTIHGDRCQEDREQALEDFRLSSARVLIATDVASRGLDIKDVTHVINYDFPRHIEEYVHRIGRTGRAGRSGMALSFITREDWSQAQKLIDIMTEAQQEIPDELIEMAERFHAHRERMAAQREEIRSGGRGGGGRGGGGRGGGGRGGGRGGCFKCGGSGHWAKECGSSGDFLGKGFRPESLSGKGRDRDRRGGWNTSEEYW